MNAAKGAALSAFVLFLACQGQQSAGQLGYSPLPTNLVAADFAAISRMNGHVAIPTTIDATTCPNPYVTGQLQSVGEPPILGAPDGGFTGTVNVGAGTGNGNAAAASVGTGGKSSILKTSSKGPGGTMAAAGQTPGVALVAASNHLLGLPGPTGAMVLWTLGFLAVIVLPLVLLALARRPGGLRGSRVDDGANPSEEGDGDDVA